MWFNVKEFSTNAVQTAASKAQIAAKPTFWHFFDAPQPAISHHLSGFSLRYRSSQPRKFWAGSQSPNSVKDFPKERLRHSHFGHLKYYVTGMADHLGSYLDELVSESSKRPLFH